MKTKPDICPQCHRPMPAKVGRPAGPSERTIQIAKMLEHGVAARFVAVHFRISVRAVYAAAARAHKAAAQQRE